MDGWMDGTTYGLNIWIDEWMEQHGWMVRWMEQHMDEIYGWMDR